MSRQALWPRAQASWDEYQLEEIAKETARAEARHAAYMAETFSEMAEEDRREIVASIAQLEESIEHLSQPFDVEKWIEKDVERLTRINTRGAPDPVAKAKRVAKKKYDAMQKEHLARREEYENSDEYKALQSLRSRMKAVQAVAKEARTKRFAEER